MLFSLLLSFALGQEPVEEIVVEAHKDYEVYIAPIEYHIYDETVEAVIPHQMVLNHSKVHSRSSKVLNERGVYEPITMQGGMMVYDKDTIEYVWDNCNYKRDHRRCSMQNDHYFLETHVTVDENELVISMTLFDSRLQPISTSQRNDVKIIRWIRQQEVTVIQQQGLMGSQTMINKPKEEMPLKWEIPHRLLSNLVYQTSMGVWTGVKIN